MRAGKQRGRRVRLQFVLGSHCASIHPVINASNWTVEGQVGRRKGWGLQEKRGGKGGGELAEERDALKRDGGVQGKIGRLLTSHCDTDKMKRGG